MKILWITNIELPAIAHKMGREVYGGGWLAYSSELLSQRVGIELVVFSPVAIGEGYEAINFQGIIYYGFEPGTFSKVLVNVIDSIQPDIIHIWGTEYEYCLETISIAEKKAILDRTIVSIQGLVTYCAMHFFNGIPYEIQRKKTLYERVRHTSLIDGLNYYKKNSSYELVALRKAKHFIGRTDWDKACISQNNSMAQYHKCNEILRSSFYCNSWNVDECDAHTIAFGQSYNPIKGLHYMLKALSIIKERYPDVRLRLLRKSPYSLSGIKERVKQGSYDKYLMQLIEKYNLNNNIEWLGSYNESQMTEYYKKANVFVSASTIENSSNSIGEAMLLGMPIVASDVGGVKSFIDHRKEGLLYQSDAPYMLADCVMQLFDDRNKACELAENARQRAKVIFDPRNNTDILVNIYRQLID